MNKLYKNIVTSALPQLMNIISNLILPSMLISAFGSEINGLISSNKAIISYISIVGAGIATAVTQSLYAPVANKDLNTVKGMLHASNRMFTKYGIVFCFISLIVALIYPLFLKTSISEITIVSLLLVMSISGASEFFAIGRCRVFLYANQKTYVSSLIQATSLLLSLILAIVLLKIHCNVIVVQAAISGVYVFRAVLLLTYIKHNYPEITDYKKVKPINSATEKRRDAMIHQLSGLVVSSSQVTILTVMVGLKAASVYAIYNIVFSGLQSISSNLNSSIAPFLGRELALNNNQKLNKMFDALELCFFDLVTVIYSVTIVMIIPFISIYTKNADINYIYPSFAIYFTFMSAFYILKLPGSSLINVAGLFKETKWRAILESIITLVASLLLTHFIGLNGVVIGTGLALTWRCLDIIIYSNSNVLHNNSNKSIFRLVRCLGIIFIFYYVSTFFNINAHNYLKWVELSVLVLIVSIVITVINSLVFDYSTVRSLLSIILGHNKKGIECEG